MPGILLLWKLIDSQPPWYLLIPLLGNRDYIMYMKWLSFSTCICLSVYLSICLSVYLSYLHSVFHIFKSGTPNFLLPSPLFLSLQLASILIKQASASLPYVYCIYVFFFSVSLSCSLRSVRTRYFILYNRLYKTKCI